MTVGPLVLAICLRVGAQYEAACTTALEQAAVQSGVEAGLDSTKRRWEKKALEFLDPSISTQIVGGAVVYLVRFANGQTATFAIPNPTRLGATSLTVGKENVGLGWRIDF